jgi:hypothetical protein
MVGDGVTHFYDVRNSNFTQTNLYQTVPLLARHFCEYVQLDCGYLQCGLAHKYVDDVCVLVRHVQRIQLQQW